ncbi:cytochrome c [Phenylobacterium sp. 20VBR1]|uniref:Cytochrome c n=1 Tax=Phenylobacterium glaciei TaxID=2803784 RepID=A0A941D4F8_9CAUL|nr:cytochrome c [Phenylobacterium glaciei]MBR7620638.1 cytochrome c [Phenylobacterium glaciei]
MRTGLLVLILLAAPAAATAADNPLLAAQARGYTLAAGVCAACHMIEPAGTSPNPRAPPFRILAGRYVPLTLQRRLADIAETGHYAMPPINIHADQVQDVVAYINSLERPTDPH